MFNIIVTYHASLKIRDRITFILQFTQSDFFLLLYFNCISIKLYK